MPDPTPTPDTLRAAIERARNEVVRLCDPHEHWRMSIPANPRRDSDLILMDALDAALAASPAPTDSPDEPCADCGHPREDHSQGDPPDYSCWHVYVWALGGCDCGSFRPAAVTAPREDERNALHDRLKRVLGDVPVGTRDLVNVLVGPDVAPWTARVLAAAAPAVERTDDPTPLPAFRQAFDAWRARPTQDESTDARSWVTGYRTALRDVERVTPDPDTRHDPPYCSPGCACQTLDPDVLAQTLMNAALRAFTPTSNSSLWWRDAQRLARALIAAGVTITPPTTGQGHTAP